MTEEIHSDGSFLSFHVARGWAVVCLFVPLFTVLFFFSRYELSLNKSASSFSDGGTYYSILLCSRGALPYVDFSTSQKFMQQYSAAMFLPHTDLRLFPSMQKVVNALTGDNASRT